MDSNATATAFTWDTLCDIEPGLRNVEAFARGMSRIHCRNVRAGRPDYYESVKRQAERLVGWKARLESLRTSEAWDVAIHHLIAILEGKQ